MRPFEIEGASGRLPRDRPQLHSLWIGVVDGVEVGVITDPIGGFVGAEPQESAIVGLFHEALALKMLSAPWAAGLAAIDPTDTDAQREAVRRGPSRLTTITVSRIEIPVRVVLVGGLEVALSRRVTNYPLGLARASTAADLPWPDVI